MTDDPPGPVLRFAALADEPRLVHGFSTLAMGSMRGPAPPDSPVTAERRALAAALGLDAEALTVAGAVHGAEIARVDRPMGLLRGFDGLVTDRPSLPLLVTLADCLPVLLYDPVRPALALVHAGWRGTASGVAARAVEALRREYGTRPAHLLAAVGPGICGGCYEVGDEVSGRFDPAFARPSPAGRWLLDLASANRAQLQGAGVAPERIHLHPACTRETPFLPSHRRSPDGSRFACMAAIGEGRPPGRGPA